MKNKKRLFTVWLIVLCSLLLVFNACKEPEPIDNLSDNPVDIPVGNPTSLSIERFQVDPHTGNDKIFYSFTYEDYDYYYIYLGELINIPIWYSTARYHDGIDWTYIFTVTESTQNSVKDVVTESRQTTIGIVDSYTKSITTGVKLSTEISSKVSAKAFGVTAEVSTKTSAEANFSLFTSNTTTNSFQETKSLTNTIEHATTYTKQTMESDQFRLNSNNKTGFYRYTLFSASDVYLYVIRNSKTNEIFCEFIDHVIPGSYFWCLDYSETPSFSKSDATGFELDISILDNINLPKPELNFIPYTVVYNANGASGSMNSTSHVGGIPQYLRENTFINHAGLEFVGWARSSSANYVEFTDGESVVNLTDVRNGTVTLYAIWQNPLDKIPIDLSKGGGNPRISSSQARVIIKDNGENRRQTEIIILERTAPLTIELYDVNLFGRIGAHGVVGQNGEDGIPVIYMLKGSAIVPVPDLTIEVKTGLGIMGINSRLQGGNGGDGGRGNDNSIGRPGGNGAAPILANNLTIRGDTNIILRGGDGGNGGRGGNLGISINGTSGGRGGNGGAAINASNISNHLTGTVYALISNGGNGGSRWQGSTGWASGGSNGARGNNGVQFTSTPNPLGTISSQAP